jgi:hypothetical protein
MVVGMVKSSVGRKKLYRERILTPLREGTIALIKAAKLPGESQSDFVRRAIEKEISRQTRAKLRGKDRGANRLHSPSRPGREPDGLSLNNGQDLDQRGG